MKIIVTGGAGFIGSHLVDAYLEAGHQVVVFDNLSSGFTANINPKADFVQIDITDPAVQEHIATIKPDLINHHAAQINVRNSVADPKNDASINILGSLNLLEANRHLDQPAKFIFASTGGAMYTPDVTLPATEDQPAGPVSPYGISKRSVELYLQYYRHLYNLDYTVLRYSNVFGPRQNAHGEAGVVAIFYTKIFNNQEFKINGSGDQTRDYVYVQDVVNANLKVSDSSYPGIFNIGTNLETSVNQLCQHLLTSIGSNQTLAHAPARPGEVERISLSYQKAKNTFGWEPQTGLTDGINSTAEYFKTHH